MNKTDENMVSLYEYLGRASGGQLGKRVAAFAAQQKVNPGRKYVDNPKYKGDVLTYPREFLDNYFKTPPQADIDEINAELNEAQFEDDLPY